ncbi:MAG: MFS transporter [Gammaproteobacteria bacterium]|nr:MAG: MFS transporter [Gammaproteobacteria bacterium]
MNAPPSDTGMSPGLPRTIYLLSLCNALLYTCASLLITMSALIGYALAEDKRLATLPMALQFLSVLVGSVPASLAMGRFGRKAGFLFAGCIGVAGSLLALHALQQQSLSLFALASCCFGLFTAFANYYRFTAAEIVPPARKSVAISMVMAGGVIAAFIGPNLARLASSLFESQPFAGPFAVLVAVYLTTMVLIAFADLPPPPPKRAGSDKGRPILDIVAQPVFVIAVTCQMLGYATMNFVMASTPLAMRLHAFDFHATAFVIQWHVFAMFAPSFVTGHLIRRFGMVPVLGTGALLGILTVLVNLHGKTLAHFTLALVLLGVCWNFLYVGGTTLMTEAYREEEKSRAQAANDLMVFSLVSLTALSAGTVHHVFGWRTVNMGVLPFLVIALASVFWLRRQQKTGVYPQTG